MSWLTQVQQDFISEKVRDNKEFVKFLILHAWLKTRRFFRSQKVESLIQKIELKKLKIFFYFFALHI